MVGTNRWGSIKKYSVLISYGMNSESYDQSASGHMTKKERRELRRQQAWNERSRNARRRFMRRILTWVIVAAVLVGIVWAVWQAAKNVPQQSGGALAVAVSADDLILGSDDASITLVEYADFQCPACSTFHPILQQLFEEADGQLRLVFRHYPISRIHPNAETASYAAQAAALQEKFWEMHDVIFERQSEWSSLSTKAARDKILEYAVELGLDTERLGEDMDSDAVKEKINADIRGGEQASVNSTPSFFVNGESISGYNSLEEFSSMVLADLGADEESQDEEPQVEPHNESDGASTEDL